MSQLENSNDQPCVLSIIIIIISTKRAQMNKPTSSGLNKEDHMVIAHRMGEMEKRRVGTRFIDREATDADHAKPLMQVLNEKGCSIM